MMRSVRVGTGTPTFTYYMGPFVHEGLQGGTSSLKYIITPEGRMVNSGTDLSPSWSWEYNLTDHLGNVRVVLGDSTAAGYARVLQQTHYYPFGMRMSQISTPLTTTGNDYLYNGKQYQDDFNLNWYDYGARFYDPALGRFTSVDPHAENYYSWSPYHYVANNPLALTDPTGMDWYQETDKDGKVVSTGAVKWQEESGAVDGYSNIGTSYTQDVGNGASITFTQNDATSMTFTGIDESNFVAQGTGTGCKVASDQMLSNEGVNSNGERINVVNSDANGVATTANGNATRGVNAVDKALENGNPIEVGVDYKSKQVNNLKPNGDGMTDHFVVVSGKTETLNNGQVTSKAYNFFDPRSSANGTSSSNTLRISNNKLTGHYLGGTASSIPYTVTTVRRSR